LTLATLMMLPDFCGIMTRAAYFRPASTPWTWTAMAASKRARSIWSMVAACDPLPGLLTKQSSRPNFSTAPSTIASTSASTVTSVRWNRAASPKERAKRSPPRGDGRQ
jgi:hypothetical protein